MSLEPDAGPTIEIASRIAADAHVVKIVSFELVDGTAVDVAK